MPQEPVFNVTKKMFEMLSDWQEQIDRGEIEDPSAQVAKIDDLPQENGKSKPETEAKNNPTGDH